MNTNKLIIAKKWIIAGGVFNCIVAFPLSIPFLLKWYINFFNTINSWLNLGGKNWIPPMDGTSMLFINTAGLALILVGMILIYSSYNVSERIMIPFLNGIVRLVWGITAIYYLIQYDIINIIYIIVGIDLLLALVYVYFFSVIRKKISE